MCGVDLLRRSAPGGWEARGKMGNDSPMRVSATGPWTFLIGPEFEMIHNGDSVQAVHGTRGVFVSSLQVGRPEQPALADEIRKTAVRRLGSGERLSHVGQSVQGDAEIHSDGDAWCLYGIMCSDGSLATCVIDFQDSDDRAWAVSVWKSLLCEKERA